MKKILLISVLCLLGVYSLTGCNGATKTNDEMINDEITNGVMTNEIITNEVITNDVITNEVITNEIITNEVITNDVIPTAVESDSDEEIFSITSEDESTVVTIITTKDNNEFRIKQISIIVNGITLNTINDIVGYYDDISLDIQTSLAAITYHGRKWSNFILLDITTGQIVYYEPFYFADVWSTYQYNNKMDYEINENDVITLSCNKILDDDSVLIGYQVTDMDDNLQSGTFKYIISKNEFSNLQQNAPRTKG